MGILSLCPWQIVQGRCRKDFTRKENCVFDMFKCKEKSASREMQVARKIVYERYEISVNF